MPFYRQTIGGRFYKDYKNGNSKRVSEKEYLKNVRRVKGGAPEGNIDINLNNVYSNTASNTTNKTKSISKNYICECSCKKKENNKAKLINNTNPLFVQQQNQPK